MNFGNILDSVNNFVWGNGLIFLLLSVGIVYTVKLGFIQFRIIPFFIGRKAEKASAGSEKGLSQFKTVCMSLGTAMGTGNITGVASALMLGGPGAIFWMWISAFFGMALVYAENSLAAQYRKNSSCCGPMAYLQFGVGSRMAAVIFAVFCVFASLGMGGMVQVNAFSDSLGKCFAINPYFLAAAVFAVIFLIVKGGAGRIGSAAQILLPAAAVCYTVVSATVIALNSSRIPAAFGSIFSQAFTFDSAAGGASGFLVSRAVSAGIRRGVFSNEAGLGSSPILHSPSAEGSPALQGMCSMSEVFFDTIICCTLTALVLLTASPSAYSVQEAFSDVLRGYSDLFLAAVMTIFAFCTVIGWYFCGETAFRYVFGERLRRIFTVIFPAAASLGAVFTLSAVWTISDIFNGLMAFPNLLALILLMKKVHKE